VTSGGYGHRVGQSLALGYIESSVKDAAGGFEIEILGERRPAKRLSAAPYDHTGSRMRA